MSTKKQTYSEAYAELESILRQVESDEPDIDKLAGHVKRAAELIRFCKGRLHETEEEIEKIIREMDQE